MSGYTYATDKPDWDREAYEDMKSSIKAFCLREVLRKTDEEKVFKRINEQIDHFATDLEELEDGVEIARRYRADLQEFSREIYSMAQNMVGTMTPYMFAQALVDPDKLTPKQKAALEHTVPVQYDISEEIAKKAAKTVYKDGGGGGGYTNATAGNAYYKEIHKDVKGKMGDFEKIRTHKIPMTNVNPRNVVEMSVRFDRYKETKQRMIEAGVKYVYVPPHANCSARCQPYQGKCYSLTGKTEHHDGRTFKPIEDVADKVTVRGKRDPSRIYAAGLFAYNCRHTMVPYQDGQKLEQIPKDTIDRTRAIETKQRELEREVRGLKEKYELLKIVRDESGNNGLTSDVKEIRQNWLLKRKEYASFCEANDLVIYEDRLKLTVGEDLYKRTIGKKDSRVKNISIPSPAKALN